MSNFQIILLVIFGFFILAGVIVFSFYRGGGSAGHATVTVWGDITQHDFNTLLSNSLISQDQSLTARYVEKSASTIEAEFTEALARGTGPDLIILTQDKLWKNKPKLTPISFTGMSERDFKATFVEEGELFLDPSGIYALPLSIDPMVLYYNRDILSSAGQANPITHWDEIYNVALNLSKIDAAGNLVASTIALGEARNIPHAKEILSLLMLQAGTPITGFVNGNLRSQVALTFDLPIAPAVSALDFYTQFSNPAKTFYSWNRSLVDAQTHFASGDSAYYLGFASEWRILKNKNPTLNLGVALVPQSRVSNRTTTFGRLRGVAISRGSKNPAAAFTLATKLVSRDVSLPLVEILGLPPARRDLLSSKPSSVHLSVFYDAAIQSKGWLDPDSVLTGDIFREAIESVTSGRTRSFEAINNAHKKLDALLK